MRLTMKRLHIKRSAREKNAGSKKMQIYPTMLMKTNVEKMSV